MMKYLPVWFYSLMYCYLGNTAHSLCGVALKKASNAALVIVFPFFAFNFFVSAFDKISH